MNLDRDIHPLTDFKRNTVQFLDQLKQTGEPVILTINGKAEIVVQDAASYQKLLDIAEEAKVLEGIRLGLEDMKAGRRSQSKKPSPTSAAIWAFRNRHEIPRRNRL